MRQPGIGVSGLVESTTQRELKLGQQRDRKLSAIVELRARLGSGTPESEAS